MRLASCIGATLLAAAAPALAGPTVTCRSTTSPNDGPALALTLGDAPLGGIAAVRSTGADLGLPPSPQIVQAWVDDVRLRVDLADARGDLVRLDTRRRAGRDFIGLLYHQGRSWRMRCTGAGRLALATSARRPM